MSDLTFLTEEQCFGDNKLEILKERGTEAKITDFSVLLGGWVYSLDDNYSRNGEYWIKTDLVLHSGGIGGYVSLTERNIGARPALSFKSIDSIPTNGRK